MRLGLTCYESTYGGCYGGGAECEVCVSQKMRGAVSAKCHVDNLENRRKLPSRVYGDKVAETDL